MGRQHLLRCRACRVLYTAPQPTEAEVEQTYTGEYITSAEMLTSDFGDRRAAALDIAVTAVRNASRGGVVLDVGCAGGAFISRFPESEWTRVGVEPSAVAVEARQPGVEIIQDTFPSAKLDGRTFDAVTMMDVIMLVPNPREALRAAHALLRPGGLLAVEIPGNMFRMATHVGPVPLLRRRRWCDLNLQLHLFCFPDRTFREELGRAGFVIEDVVMLAASTVSSTSQNRALHLVERLLRAVPWTAHGKVSLAPKYLYLARKPA